MPKDIDACSSFFSETMFSVIIHFWVVATGYDSDI